MALKQIDPSSSFFEQIAAITPDVICRLQLQPVLAVEFINAAIAAVTGYTPAEFQADPDLARRIVHPEDRPLLQQVIAASGATVHCRARLIAKDSRIVPVDLHLEMERAGDILRLKGLARDASVVEQLRGALRLQNALVDCSTDAIISADLEGFVISWNPGAERLYGYTADEAIGGNLVDLIGAGPVDDMRLNFAHIREGTPVSLPHVRRRDKHGNLHDVSVSIAPMRDEQGRVSGLVAIARDIGAEIKAYQATARLAAIVDSSDDAIIGKDLHGTITSWNRGAERLYGYTAAEAVGRHIGMLFPQHHDDDFRTIMERIQQGQRIQQLETVRRAKEGRLIDVSVTISPIRDDDGGIIGASTIARDITASKRLAEALRQSEKQYRLLAENVRDVVWVMDIDEMRFTYMSPSVEKLRGYTPEEVMAQSALEALTPESAARLAVTMQDEIARFLAGDPANPSVMELEQPCRDGSTVWTETAGIYYVNPDTGHLEAYAITRDITERRALEQELRALNEHLEQRVAARTTELEAALAELRRADQAKDAFLAAVSHELRTPLTGVLGMTEMLLEQAETFSPQQTRYISTIHASGERLLNVINSILSYTSLASGQVPIQPAPCHLAELCAIAVRSMTGRAERKRQKIELNVVPFDLAIISDAEGIVEILKKLLDNAVKFSPEGGTIGLLAERAPGGDGVRLVVSDSGIGIPASKTAELFQAFHQADGGLARPFEGVGLGLAYVKKMVELLGGTIIVESEFGYGSRFTVVLPGQLRGVGYATNTPHTV